MKKLAIITTHPIQYYAPVFKLLSNNKNLNIKVYYTWGEGSLNKFDPGFKQKIEWDLPLLEGYQYDWVLNVSKNPGTHRFGGIVNPTLISDIKLWKPDAVLIYGWSFSSHLKIIRHFHNKVPIYFRGDSTLIDNQSGFKSALKTVLLKWIYKHINFAFFVGTNNKSYFKKYGLKEKQLIFAPHAIDNERFSIDRKNEAIQLRRKLGINYDAILILFAGKLEDKKAPLDLLEAFIALKNKNVHLLFVGNGILENRVKDISSGYENLHFLDFQNQSYMPVVYQACNIFCLPSIGPNETWGLTINEAMACGKPILASNKVGGAVDLVIPGVNGEIFKAGIVGDLKEKLELLLEKEKEGLKIMGESSKKIIEQWSFEIQANIIANYVVN
jgi:glycosyltransferase involved in cell wall biosynthesis